VRTPKIHDAANGTRSWKVRYRSPTTQRQTSETFYDEAQAEEFCGVLDALGVVRALAWLEQQQADDGPRDVLTVDGLFERWIEWKGARNKKGELRRVRSERTIDDYRGQYQRKIQPIFGTLPANLVSGQQVQDWVERLGDEIEPKTVADYHALLHGIYKWGTAPSRQLVLFDPCTETELPARKKKPPKGLHPEQWQILFAAARDVDADAADALFFKVSSGWRISEVFAVQCRDVVDMGDGTISVGMNRVMRREHGTTIVEDAKSEAGARDVRLVGDAAAMVLARVRDRLPEDLVFTNQHDSRWLYSSFYYRYWTRPKPGSKTRDYAPRRKRILERARELGLTAEPTPHWLRHTHVGLLILAGESPAAIQRRIGHASIKTTYDVYGRWIEDATVENLTAVNALLAAPNRSAIEQGQ
jgi:integrase